MATLYLFAFLIVMHFPPKSIREIVVFNVQNFGFVKHFVGFYLLFQLFPFHFISIGMVLRRSEFEICTKYAGESVNYVRFYLTF